MKLSGENLEPFVDRAMKDMPDRPAPSALEARVRAEIARRAGLPWWRHSYSRWPAPARGAFVAVCLLLAAVLVWGLALARGAAAADAALLAARVPWIAAAGACWDAAHSVWQAIPPLWLYGAAGIIAGCYAAAYRAVSKHS